MRRIQYCLVLPDIMQRYFADITSKRMSVSAEICATGCIKVAASSKINSPLLLVTISPSRHFQIDCCRERLHETINRITLASGRRTTTDSEISRAVTGAVRKDVVFKGSTATISTVPLNVRPSRIVYPCRRDSIGGSCRQFENNRYCVSATASSGHSDWIRAAGIGKVC